MRLAVQPPRRQPTCRIPRYPALLAGALVATAGCRGSSSAEPIAPDPGTVAPAARPHVKPPAAPTFAVDDEPLDMNVGCKGDCPSPFELAIGRKDRAQIQARVDHCVREAERSAPVPSAEFLVRSEVAASGKVVKPAIDPQQGKLSADVQSCVLALVEKAPLTAPPGDAGTRQVHAYVKTHAK
ncbi:MAG: hypothetical protein HYV09_02660 [Deltaproteobacteria bacterium]|nr:hypothetical protein [Deltaproteobacteria bacterium]